MQFLSMILNSGPYLRRYGGSNNNFRVAVPFLAVGSNKKRYGGFEVQVRPTNQKHVKDHNNN